MRRNCFLAATCLLVCSILFSPAGLFGQTPQGYSWNVAAPNVASVTWTNQQIATFLDTITNSLVPFAVADYVFKDLNADGQLELLASVDFSGRGIFNTLVVVRRQTNSFSVQQIEALGVEKLQGTFADLNGDGRDELLVPTAITPYLGASVPQASWTAIYGWNGPLLVDESAEFTTYYETTILPALQSALDNLQATSPGTLQTDVAQIEYDKILRVTGQDPIAGLAQALAWASAGDSTHRIFAAAVLADIGTTTAITALNALTKDPDPDVVIYAQAEVQLLPALHFTPVQIEIKPGSTIAPINLSSHGKIPVAILSTANFNAPASVDIKTLTFGSSGTEDSLVSCDPNGEDVNRDGIRDLVCHFDALASSFQLGDASGTLEGQLKDGTAIKGTGAIIVVSH